MKRQNLHPPYYYAYLLRFWQEGDPGHWRVLLEDPHSGERLGFGSMEELITFLNEQTQSGTQSVTHAITINHFPRGD